MSVQSNQLTGHQQGLDVALDANATALAAGKLHLTAAPFIPQAHSTLAELTAGEAKSPGYAAKVIGPLLGPFTGQGGVRYWMTNAVTFAATAGSPTEQISGGWIDDGTGTINAVFTVNPLLTLGGTPGPTIAINVEYTGVIFGQVEVGP